MGSFTAPTPAPLLPLGVEDVAAPAAPTAVPVAADVLSDVAGGRGFPSGPSSCSDSRRRKFSQSSASVSPFKIVRGVGEIDGCQGEG
jgi:hypothetical protein